MGEKTWVSTGQRVAIVHDYLNQRGGAERVVAALHEAFPEAPIFTSIVDYDNIWPELKGADIRPTWMQRLPGIKRHFKKYLLLYPKAFESIDLAGFDVVLSSSSAFAKGALKPEGAVHICYCYTPMRFAWDYERYIEKEGFGAALKGVLPFLIRYLKRWDLKSKDRPDHYIAISRAVKGRIREFYGRDARIIYPPVDTGRFRISPKVGDFYLIVSRLNAYKGIDLAIEACNALKLPLKIAGGGPHADRLKAVAGPTVEFLGRVPDGELPGLYSSCKAFIFPGEEDFGIAPVEANAAGRPVIALKAGGALDTIREGINGIFFEERSSASLKDAILRLERSISSFDPDAVRAEALKFDKAVFVREIKDFIQATAKIGGIGIKDLD